MSSTQFFCKNKDRWKVVSNSTSINGIDYLEVSEDQQTLTVYFLHNLPGQPGGIPTSPVLAKENIFIEGGVRVKNITVTDPVTVNNNVLTFRTNSAGDFSNYFLKFGNSSTDKDTPPGGFDQQLSTIEFSFKINCVNEFDCKTDTVCPPLKTAEPTIDYLAKDYASFKRLMLDRMSVIMPGWKERNAADLQIALVELLAYVGDHLSYYQDAVATEAYLQTARRRISVKRHARLLDYFVHDGCNARVWAHIQVTEGGMLENQPLEKGTILMTNGSGISISVAEEDLNEFISEQDPVIFETMHKIILHSAHNYISFYTWSDNDCCLPVGCTSATLLDGELSSPLSRNLSLVKGDVLIFEEVYDPTTGRKADADPAHRHIVRLKNVQHDMDLLTGSNIVKIEWYDEDALPFSLCLTSNTANEDNADNNEKTIARGNMVLADHGSTRERENPEPPGPVDGITYYPELSAVNNTVKEDYEHESRKKMAASLSLVQDPHKAIPFVVLNDGRQVWESKKDLLGSDRFAAEFIVEIEQDGRSYLRFGDDICGRKPSVGSVFKATYRTGNGKSGNIGAETLNTIVSNTGGISTIRNPLPAAGGSEAETMEEVRQFAPTAFRTQERAVTAADYIQKTELHSEVQKAAAKFYWTGSWYTVYIIIDRKNGKEIDDEFKETIRIHLEQYRMAGYDLEIRGPQYVPLHIEIEVCVKEGYFKANVRAMLLQVFSNYELADGKKGFFHPDNFTFGQPLYLAAIYKEAMLVAGVNSVEIKTCKRWAKNPANEKENGFLKPSALEIIRLDNDPSLPENGKIDFIMFNGL